MDIGIIGSATVAQTLGGKFLELGHAVTISSRDANRKKDLGERGTLPGAEEWAEARRGEGAEATAGSFAAAAAFGEVLFNCTAGSASLAALELAGAESLGGKILVDVSNPLDFSKGMPPILSVSNTDSVAERIQAAYPAAKVIKTLNTVSAPVMIDPAQLGDATHLFVAGNDADAKSWVARHVLREWLGWEKVLDIGDITAARGAEMYLPLWLRLFGATGTPLFNVKVVTVKG
jgi:hypothetical protein